MMTITPPLGYGPIKPLSHADCVFLPAGDTLPPFVAGMHAVPLGRREMTDAARCYPLVFLHQPGSVDAPLLVGLMGLAPQQNLFVDPFTGDWDPSAYRPAFVRRWPLCTATVRIDSTQQTEPELLVCVETSAASSTPRAGFKPLFGIGDDNRWPSIEQSLRRFDADLAASHALTQTLTDLQLLEPLEVLIPDSRPGDNGASQPSLRLHGMLAVNQRHLADLPADQALRLHHNGMLASIHAHLLSLRGFEDLARRQSDFARRQSQRAGAAEPSMQPHASVGPQGLPETKGLQALQFPKTVKPTRRLISSKNRQAAPAEQPS